jgi:hypothetical protein
MSATSEAEDTFHDHINDLIRCFKYLTIFDTKHKGSIKFDLLIQPNNPGSSEKKDSMFLYGVSCIVPDTSAKLLVKDKLQLVPAILELQLTKDYEETDKCPLFSAPLDSNIVNLITEKTGGDTVADTIANWYVLSNRGGAPIDVNNVSITKVPLNLQWKIYHPAKIEDTDNILYAHFPVNDTWLAIRFSKLSDDYKSVQIMNEHEGYIVDCYDLHVNYKIHSPTFVGAVGNSAHDNYSKIYDLEPKLDKGALFDTAEVSDASYTLVTEFKEDQDDPYFDVDLQETEELHFLCGSEANLEHMLILICHASIPLELWNDVNSVDVEVVSAMSDEGSAHIDYENMYYADWTNIKDKLDPNKFEFIERAFAAAVTDNEPSGYTWEYNDGAYDRQSGYDKNAYRLTFTVTAPSAHEQICAKVEIKKLAHLLGKDNIEGLLK